MLDARRLQQIFYFDCCQAVARSINWLVARFGTNDGINLPLCGIAFLLSCSGNLPLCASFLPLYGGMTILPYTGVFLLNNGTMLLSGTMLLPNSSNMVMPSPDSTIICQKNFFFFKLNSNLPPSFLLFKFKSSYLRI